jgi:hypothetical protein
MRALWPSLMEMIKQGHLEQPFYTDQLFFIGDIALQQNSDVEGEGGSATVYVVTLGDNSKVRTVLQQGYLHSIPLLSVLVQFQA